MPPQHLAGPPEGPVEAEPAALLSGDWWPAAASLSAAGPTVVSGMELGNAAVSLLSITQILAVSRIRQREMPR